jgi:cell division protein FtsL
MINLLPPKEKEKVFNEKKQRIISTLMFFLVVFLLFTSVTFYTTKHFGLQIINIERDLFHQKKKDFAGLIEKEEDVKKLNNRLLKIDNFTRERVNLDKIFTRIDNLSSDILLESFDYEQITAETENKSAHQITLAGKASTWEQLVNFEEKLKNNFSEVKFSEDSWSQVENINFLVKFNINGEKK